jgi:hypothetical protein
MPIRRDGIKEKVFGGEKVARFSPIFDLAQTQLRTVFGMEMVELPTKDRAHLTLDQKRKGLFFYLSVISHSCLRPC